MEKTCNFSGNCVYKTTGTFAGCQLESYCIHQSPNSGSYGAVYTMSLNPDLTEIKNLLEKILNILEKPKDRGDWYGK